MNKRYFETSIDFDVLKNGNLYEFLDVVFNAYRDSKEVECLKSFRDNYRDLLISFKIKERKNNSRFNLETQLPKIKSEFIYLKDRGYSNRDAAIIVAEGTAYQMWMNDELDWSIDINGIKHKKKYKYAKIPPDWKCILYMVDDEYRDWRHGFRKFKEFLEKYKLESLGISVDKISNDVEKLFKTKTRNLKTLSENTISVVDVEKYKRYLVSLKPDTIKYTTFRSFYEARLNDFRALSYMSNKSIEEVHSDFYKIYNDICHADKTKYGYGFILSEDADWYDSKPFIRNVQSGDSSFYHRFKLHRSVLDNFEKYYVDTFKMKNKKTVRQLTYNSNPYIFNQLRLVMILLYNRGYLKQ